MERKTEERDGGSSLYQERIFLGNGRGKKESNRLGTLRQGRERHTYGYPPSLVRLNATCQSGKKNVRQGEKKGTKGGRARRGWGLDKSKAT